jgi:hypothetical protein
MVTGFSTVPLRLASFIGFFFTLFGVGVLIYVVGGISFPGAAFRFRSSRRSSPSSREQLFASASSASTWLDARATMDRPVYVVRSHKRVSPEK